MSEYEPSYSIWREDDEDMTILKEGVMSLPPADRIIFLIYCEKQSLRDTGKELGVSHTVVYKQIKMIRGMLRDWIGTHYPNRKDILERIKL